MPEIEKITDEERLGLRENINYVGTINLEPSRPAVTIDRVIWFLYGERKIGKTSTFSNFPGAYFFMFEPGSRGLNLRRTDIGKWGDFVKSVKELVELKKSGKADMITMAVLDTIDRMYDMANNFVCAREGWDHPSEGKWGAGWQAVKKEMISQIELLLGVGITLAFVSHATDKEFEGRTGGKYNKLVPSASKQILEFASGLADVIAYYGYWGSERFVTIRGTDEVECGNRLKYNFLTPDGVKIHSIPMGNSDEEGYAAIVRAFDNKQTEVCDPSIDFTANIEKRVKK